MGEKLVGPPSKRLGIFVTNEIALPGLKGLSGRVRGQEQALADDMYTIMLRYPTSRTDCQTVIISCNSVMMLCIQCDFMNNEGNHKVGMCIFGVISHGVS